MSTEIICPYCNRTKIIRENAPYYMRHRGKLIKSEYIGTGFDGMYFIDTHQIYMVASCDGCVKRRKKWENYIAYIICGGLFQFGLFIVLYLLSDIISFDIPSLFGGISFILAVISIILMYLIPGILNLTKHNRIKVSIKQAIQNNALIAFNDIEQQARGRVEIKIDD